MAAPLDDNYIINFIKRKINNNLTTSYDKIVVLATFGFIVLTNDEYKTYFNNWATEKANEKTVAAAAAGTSAPSPVDPDNLEDADWGFDPDEIFRDFVSTHLLKTEADPSPLPSPLKNSTQITTDLNIQFGDSFIINFNNNQIETSGAFDNVETKINFEKNFVNLAQAFYETEFCVEITGVTENHTAIADLKPITNFLNYVKFAKNSHTREKTFQKSLQVLYYNGAASIGAKLDKNDFSNFVKFEKMLGLDELRKKSQVKNTKANIQHQIIVLDDKKLTLEKFENKILKQKSGTATIDRNFGDMYTTIIVVSDTIDFLPTYVDATAPAKAILKTIRLIHIRKDVPPSSTTTIETITHQCEKKILHNFSANIVKDKGTNENITIITYEDGQDQIAILKYAVLSNVVVFIESDN